MPIAWRPATRVDIEPGLMMQLRYRGDALVGEEAALGIWKRLSSDPLCTATAVESEPAIRGHHIVGFGASVLVSRAFADAEIANPRPDINSRIIAGIHSDQPVLAPRSEVARANAEGGVDVVILCGVWRDGILNPEERQQVKTLLATSFTERHAGYRIRRIFCEAVDQLSTEFIERSIVYRRIAEFPEAGRRLYLMTAESAKEVPGSLANVLFSFRKPILRLRDSDQQMLSAALQGATDSELAAQLEATVPAIKARWRSTFGRIAAAMPDLVHDDMAGESRGAQKRHRVLAYMRSHPEELRPYDWKIGNREVGRQPR